MKILASDLDGTLIINNDISKKDIQAIHKLKKHGGKFIISTGRSFNGVKAIIENYPLQYDYLSLCNGGLVIDKDNNVIWDKWVPNKVFKSIVEDYYLNEDVILSCDNSKKVSLLCSKKGDMQKEFSKFNIPFEKIEKEEIENMEEDYKMLSLFTFSGDVVWAEKVKNEIIEKYGEYVEAYRNEYFIDIAPKNCSKGNALLKILDIEGENPKNLYTVGDSFNDLSMIKITKNGYTFNRAEEGLKEEVNNLIDNVYEIVDEMLK